jgi:hypothetical protein
LDTSIYSTGYCGVQVLIPEDGNRIPRLKEQSDPFSPMRFMKVGCTPADRIETIGVHEFPERVPVCEQVPESLQECFSSGIPTAALYLVFGNECFIYQFHKHYNFGFACFLGEAFLS